MKKFIYGAMSFLPTLAFAAIGNTVGLLNDIAGLIGKVIPIMFALAIIYFFWGLVKFIQGAGDPKKTAEGRGIMIYGVIAIAVMASIYGLIGWLQTTLGVSGTGTVVLPTVPGIPQI